ncbi:MAG: holin [Serratia fonticola]
MPYKDTFIKLAIIGAIIAFGKMMLSGEKITLRLLIGRVILGSAVAQVAGLALLHFDNPHPLALIGIASALGITGHTAVEEAVKHWLKNKEPKP